MNVLKSLVLQEKSHRESDKHDKGTEPLKEEVSSREFDESKSREDSSSNFEKLKAHKSTIEAVVSEVISFLLFLYDKVQIWNLDISSYIYDINSQYLFKLF